MIIQYAIILLLVATMAAVCLMMIPHKVDAQYNLPSHYRRRNDHSVSKLLEEVSDLNSAGPFSQWCMDFLQPPANRLRTSIQLID